MIDPWAADDIMRAIRETRPDIYHDAPTKSYDTITGFGNWLQEHYPREGGWGNVLIGDTAQMIREWKP